MEFDIYLQFDKITNTLALKGIWNTKNLSDATKEFDSIDIKIGKKLKIDVKNLSFLDSNSAIFLVSKLRNFDIDLGDFGTYKNTIDFYYKNYQTKDIEAPKKPDYIYNIGRYSYDVFLTFKQFINFVGETSFHIYILLTNLKNFRFKAVVDQIESVAYKALIIVIVTSFLVGVVIAYQGAVQLAKFGANIFVVEMITISMFREIAPLITAIVIAGRSASSMTAEIGAMKITDEIDAMKTMGFEPAHFITLPRVFALAISLPLLVFISDIIGILGGMVVSFFSLDITYIEFINRLRNEVGIEHFYIGIFKAFVFGIFIAFIACFRGFQVQNNTTSIGKYTTISVVNAIFIVILLDAIFSIIFTNIGI